MGSQSTGLAVEESIMVSGMYQGSYACKPTKLNVKNWFKYLFVRTSIIYKERCFFTGHFIDVLQAHKLFMFAIAVHKKLNPNYG